MALGQFVELPGPLTPAFRRTADETMKLGCDNPDSYYLMANLSGSHEYRIRGKRGSVPYMSLSTYYGGYGSGCAGCGGRLESADLEIAADGSFEVIISTGKQAGNWLPMDPETNQLIVRQTRHDRAREALVIRARAPECDYWNFQVNNYWIESLDYRFHKIDINHTQAHYEPDGSFRIVVAHRDPGVPNWLETAGHHHGTMGLRWVNAREHPKPDCQVVRLAELH